CACATPSAAAGLRCTAHSSARPRALGRPAAGSGDTPPVPTRPGPAVGPASDLFCDHLPQDLLVERQIGDELLQFSILLAELTQLAHLGRAQVPELLLPAVVRLLADLVLPTKLRNRHAALPLPEDVHHLLRRELARPHRPVSFPGFGDRTEALYASRRGSGK